MRILLNVDLGRYRDNETIDIHYLDPGGTNYTFVTRMSVPPLRVAPLINPPELAFSADGSKFAMGMACRGVSVWDIQGKVPLQTFTEGRLPFAVRQPERFLQFSSGNSGKEILAFVEVCLVFIF